MTGGVLCRALGRALLTERRHRQLVQSLSFRTKGRTKSSYWPERRGVEPIILTDRGWLGVETMGVERRRVVECTPMVADGGEGPSFRTSACRREGIP